MNFFEPITSRSTKQVEQLQRNVGIAKGGGKFCSLDANSFTDELFSLFLFFFLSLLSLFFLFPSLLFSSRCRARTKRKSGGWKGRNSSRLIALQLARNVVGDYAYNGKNAPRAKYFIASRESFTRAIVFSENKLFFFFFFLSFFRGDGWLVVSFNGGKKISNIPPPA